VIKIYRYAGLFALLGILLLATWVLIPNEKISSDRQSSLDTKKAHQSKSFSVQNDNPKDFTPAPDPRSQGQPISEPVSMLLLGTGLIGLSIVGRKLSKH
jgi:hypothetical protein